MKTTNLILKIVAGLAAVAGVVFVIATYGDKIVAWSKKMLSKITGKANDECECECDCECEADCDECPCEADCDECPCCASCDEAEEEVAEEEVAEEADFEEAE